MNITLDELAEMIYCYVFPEDMRDSLIEDLELTKDTYEISVNPTKLKAITVLKEEKNGR